MKINVTNILLGALVVIMTTILVLQFTKTEKAPDLEKYLKGYELALEAERGKSELATKLLDDEIARRNEIDSDLQKQDTKVITKYEKVPVIVSNLDKEQLRTSISKY